MSEASGEPTIDLEIATIVETIERAEAMLRSKLAQKKRLDAEIAELAKALTGHRHQIATGRPRANRSAVKTTVLDLLKERGSYGLNAVAAVELAGNRGIPLQRSTVSSLLSRFKNEGTVEYDGRCYRLPQSTQ